MDETPRSVYQERIALRSMPLDYADVLIKALRDRQRRLLRLATDALDDERPPGHVAE